MTKKEMLAEIKFPIYVPRNFQFTVLELTAPPIKDSVSGEEYHAINYNMPSAGAWIICTVKVNDTLMTGLYKWQEKDNPDDIMHWSYINIEASVGLSRMVEYKHASHPKVILICDEKQKDFKIEPKKTNTNIN